MPADNPQARRWAIDNIEGGIDAAINVGVVEADAQPEAMERAQEAGLLTTGLYGARPLAKGERP